MPRHLNSDLAAENRNSNPKFKLHFGEDKDEKISKDGDWTKMEIGRRVTVDKGARK